MKKIQDEQKGGDMVIHMKCDFICKLASLSEMGLVTSGLVVKVGFEMKLKTQSLELSIHIRYLLLPHPFLFSFLAICL